MAAKKSTTLPKLVLLCGYAGHGKDTFLSRNLDIRLGYDVYSKDGRPFPHFPGAAPLKRISFADRVKEETAAILGISAAEIEAKKNELLPAHISFQFTQPPAHGVPITYRSCLIDVAMSKRRQNPYHWCSSALRNLYEPEGDVISVVTDFRFKTELEYTRAFIKSSRASMITVRIHRPNIAIAPRSR